MNGSDPEDYLESTPPAKLVEDGKLLMCIEQAPTCRSDPQAALRLLSAASRRSPAPDANTLYLLALAQSVALEYPEAIATLKHVVELSVSSTTQGSRQLAINALNQLGTIYSRTGDSRSAAIYYAKSLERNPAQPDIYVRQSEVVFGADPVGAIKLLLDGLHHNPQATSIRNALRNEYFKVETT